MDPMKGTFNKSTGQYGNHPQPQRRYRVLKNPEKQPYHRPQFAFVEDSIGTAIIIKDTKGEMKAYKIESDDQRHEIMKKLTDAEYQQVGSLTESFVRQIKNEKKRG